MEYLLEMGQMINIKSFANFIREDLDVVNKIAKELVTEQPDKYEGIMI